MKNFYTKLIFTLVILFSNFTFAHSPIIEINKGNTAPLPIAINNFNASTSQDKSIADSITDVIQNDLRNSGLFKLIPKDAYLEHYTGVNHTPSYSAWKAIGVSFLVNGQVTKLSKDRYQVTFILWDNLLHKHVIGKSFDTNPKLLRKVAHKIADTIYSKLTGQPGYFDTKIAYITESIARKKKVKRLAIMDYDGYNPQFLTDGKSLVLTPRLSPDGTKVLYVSYERRVPKVFIMDINSGHKRLLGNVSGISYAPRFSPDGKKVLISIAKNGFSNIHEINLHNFQITKLTNNFAINTSPSYSPDASKIVYNSDINGSRHLYVMNSDGSNAKRISYGDGAYASPVWSPRGDLIACTRITRNDGFTLSVIKPDGSADERTIAKGYIVESPSWAPNGSVVAYTKYNYPAKGKDLIPSIHFTDIAGHKDTKIMTTQVGASAPEWSR